MELVAVENLWGGLDVSYTCRNTGPGLARNKMWCPSLRWALCPGQGTRAMDALWANCNWHHSLVTQALQRALKKQQTNRTGWIGRIKKSLSLSKPISQIKHLQHLLVHPRTKIIVLTCSLCWNTGNISDVDILIPGTENVSGSGVNWSGACLDYRIAMWRFAGVLREIISIMYFKMNSAESSSLL